MHKDLKRREILYDKLRVDRIDFDKLNEITQVLYEIAFCMILYDRIASFSEAEFPLSGSIFSIAYYALPFIAMVRLFICYRPKEAAIKGGTALLLCLLISHFNYGRVVKVFFLLALGSVEIDYRSLLKHISIFSFAILFLEYIASFAGLIYNTGDVSSRRITAILGTINSSDAASWILFAAIALFVAGGLPTYVSFVVLLICHLLSKFYFSSDTSTYASLVLMLLILYGFLEEKFSDNNPVFKVIKKIINIVAVVLTPVLTAFIVIFVVLYNNGNAFAYKIDDLIHKRLVYAAAIYNDSGIGLWGTWGYNVYGEAFTTDLTYTYLDDSYINLLVNYGIIFTVIVLSCWIYMIVKAIKTDNRRLVFATIALSLHSFEEGHFLDDFFSNYLVLIPFYSAWIVPDKLLNFKKPVVNIKFIKKAVLIIEAVIVYLLLFTPAVSRSRTFMEISGLDDEYAFSFPVMLAIGLVFGFAFIFTYICYKLLDKNKNRIVIVLCAAYVLAVFAVYVITGSILKNYSEQYKERLFADTQAINLITEAATEPVYADVLPEIYYNEFEGIKRSLYSGHDLARTGTSTIIVDSTDTRQMKMMRRGWLYAQLTDTTSVYTNDKSVETALVDAGYHLAGYYYTENEVNVSEKYFAQVNIDKDKVTFSGTIKLKGDKKPWADRICVINASNEDGSMGSVNISAKDLDENNEIDFVATFATNGKQFDLSITGDNSYNFEIVSYELTDDTQVTFEKTYSTDDFYSYSVNGGLTLTLRTNGSENESFIGTDSLGKLVIAKGDKTVYEGNIYPDQLIAPSDTSVSDIMEYDVSYKGSSTYTASITLAQDVDLDITKITYRSYPDIDEHNFYNDDYQIVRTEFFDLEGNKAANTLGQYATEFEYDKNENVTDVRYYGEDYELMLISQGYAEVKRVYNDLNYIIEESYYGLDGEPVLCTNGYASLRQEVDVEGNPTHIWYYDTEGNPIITASGYAELVREYNSDNKATYEAYYDTEGNRIDMAQGYSGCRYDYDDSGRINVIIYLDEEDYPVMTTYGYSEVHREYDERGRVTVETYYGTVGEIMEIEAGYATVVKEYDDDGNNISIRYFGIETSEGYTEVNRKFDSQGRIIYEEKRDSDGNLIILSGAYCACSREYDEDGNVSVVIYYGEDGNPILIGGEYAEVHYRYDDNKLVNFEAFYDGYGNKVTRSACYHALGYEYDEEENKSVIRYYGTDDNLLLINDQYCEVHRTYDDLKRTATESYYGLSGEKVTLSAGYHMVEYEYDEVNNISALKYYDENGNPTLINSGVFEIRRTFNENKKIIREEYYGLDGNSIANTSGVAYIEREYYDDGTISGEFKYDINNNLIVQ